MNHWKEDMGIDEMTDDTFQQIIFDPETGENICAVWGRTLEELAQNVDRILTTNYNL